MQTDTLLARPSAEELFARAERLVPSLIERAAAVDRGRVVSATTYRALHNAGLFRILQPAAYGGYEMGPHEHAMVTMTLARGCASTAWVYSLLSSDSLFVAAFPKAAQDDVWAATPEATLAGSVFSNPGAASAIRTPGGCRLTGRWGFVSGSDHAEWFVFNAHMDGAKEASMFLVPKSECALLGDWRTIGMRGTGSQTVVVDDAFVPEHRVVPTTEFYTGAHTALHPSFDMLQSRNGLSGLHLLSSVAVGAALGVVDQFIEVGAQAERLKAVMGGAQRLVESEVVLTKFAQSAAEADIARFRIEHGSRLASERVRRREPPLLEDLLRERRDDGFLVRAAIQSIDRMHGLLGSRACLEDDPTGRALRDVHTLAAHVTLNADRSGAAFARHVLGLEPA
jgi:alkylation response protein AidB-like acyl-CoA dehydrogenase